MTIQERIQKNREIDARVVAKKLAEAPARQAKLERSIKRALTNLYKALPESEKLPFVVAMSKNFR